MSIEKSPTAYERKDFVFATAFGLNDSKCNGVDTCDFIALLKLLEKKKEIIEKVARWKEHGHKNLIQFANAPHAEPWIKEKLSQKQAGILLEFLKDDDELTKQIIALIPPEGTYDKACIAKDAGEHMSLGWKIAPAIVAVPGVLSLLGIGGSIAVKLINSLSSNPTWFVKVLLLLVKLLKYLGYGLPSVEDFELLQKVGAAVGCGSFAVSGAMALCGLGVGIVGNQTKNKVTEAVDNHEALRLVHDTIGDVHKAADLI